MSMDPAAWHDELALHAQLFDMLKLRLPAALVETMTKIRHRLGE